VSSQGFPWWKRLVLLSFEIVEEAVVGGDDVGRSGKPSSSGALRNCAKVIVGILDAGEASQAVDTGRHAVEAVAGVV
jgi:hypothetical protein